MSKIELISSKMYANMLIDNNAAVKAGVGIIITDNEGRILLEKRSDSGMWSLPGGAIDPGESVMNAAVREAKEETNLDIEINGLLGIYSEPSDGRIVTYPDNGDVRHLVDAIFFAKVISGKIAKSDESVDLKYFYLESLPSDIAPPALQPLKDYKVGKKFVIR